MDIGLDMDGPIADFTGALLEQYNYLTNEGVKLTDLKSVKTTKWVGDPYTLKNLINSPGFIRGLKPVDGAIDAVNELVKLGHNVFFVSNGTNCPSYGHEKRAWLKYYFSKTWQFPPLVLTYHKYLVRCDVLLDDNPRNFKKLHPDTKALLWHEPYNATVQGYDRIYDWSNFLDWVIINEVK